MTGPADQAADLFIHYFRTLGKVDRADWDSDYSAEIRNAVDRLMDAARDIAREEAEGLRAVVRTLSGELASAWTHIGRLEETVSAHGDTLDELRNKVYALEHNRPGGVRMPRDYDEDEAGAS